MGCNMNHFMTNCSLYSSVEMWMQRAKSKRLAKAGKYNDVSRFVDNFINYINREFENIVHVVCSQERVT